jgi:hypothetical protein
VQVTNKLRLRLDEEERKQLAKRPTESREAYYLYLKAMYWTNKWSAEGVRKGVEYTRQAIDADPAYAKAWTALAILYVLIGSLEGAPPIETFARAKAAAVKALEIEIARPMLTQPWHSFGSSTIGTGSVPMKNCFVQ